MQSKHKQTNCKHSRRKSYTDYSFLRRYYHTKSKNYLKDDIDFVTEFPCLLGHPVHDLPFKDRFATYPLNLNPVKNMEGNAHFFSDKKSVYFRELMHTGSLENIRIRSSRVSQSKCLLGHPVQKYQIFANSVH